MKKPVVIATLAALAVTACNRSDPAQVNNNEMVADDISTNVADNAVAAVDATFVTEAIEGDNAEVAIGQLAMAKGGSQKVKDFGKMLSDDHGAHRQKLAILASSAGLTVTDEPSEEGKANLEKLRALSGAEFDKQFKAMMIDDHTKDIAKYEQQASAADAATATLARETLPTLRKHLETANAL